jgi:dsDNA-specific endonuclease/ATPase MutS2
MLSKHDILTAQLNAFKRFSNQMIQLKVKRFRVVHGIGEGRLKLELRTLVQGKDGMSMHDDQVSRGKVGASLIEIQTSIARHF